VSRDEGRRKKEEDRSVWAVILKEVLVKLLGLSANKEEDASVVNLPTFDMLITDHEPVSKMQTDLTLCFKVFAVSALPVTMRYET
jgi:hypothetical protein